MKGTSDIQGGIEVSGIKAKAGGQLTPRQRGSKAIVRFLNPPPMEPQRQQAGAMSDTPANLVSAPPWIPLRLLPTQQMGPP